MEHFTIKKIKEMMNHPIVVAFVVAVTVAVAYFVNHPIVVVVVVAFAVAGIVAVVSIAFMKNLNDKESSNKESSNNAFVVFFVALAIITTAVLMAMPIYPKGENDSPLLYLTGLTTGVTIIILGILLFFYYISRDFIKNQVTKAKKKMIKIEGDFKIDRTEIIASAITMKEHGFMARAFIESIKEHSPIAKSTENMANALKYQRNNDYKNALDLWREMSNDKNTSNPVRAAAFVSRGYLSLYSPKRKDDPKKHYHEVAGYFKEAINLKPGYPEAYCYLGLAKVRQTQAIEDLDKAIEDFDKAINLKPGYPEAYCYRGLAKVRQTQYEGAIKDFDMALQAKSDYMEAYYYRGLANVKLENYNNALPDLSMAIKLYEDNLAPPSKDAEPKN